MKIEEQDSDEFYSDAWLKQCVEVKSEIEEHSKLDVKSDVDDLGGQESFRDVNRVGHNDDLIEEDESVTVKKIGRASGRGRVMWWW